MLTGFNATIFCLNVTYPLTIRVIHTCCAEKYLDTYNLTFMSVMCVLLCVSLRAERSICFTHACYMYPLTYSKHIYPHVILVLAFLVF